MGTGNLGMLETVGWFKAEYTFGHKVDVWEGNWGTYWETRWRAISAPLVGEQLARKLNLRAQPGRDIITKRRTPRGKKTPRDERVDDPTRFVNHTQTLRERV